MHDNKISKIKKINKLSFLMILLSFIVIIGIPSIYAESDNMISAMCNQINNGVIETARANFTPKNKLFKAVITPKNLGTLTDFMNWQAVLCTMAIAIMSMYRMFDTLNKGHDVLQTFLKMLIDVCLSFVLFSYVPDILGFIVDGGTDFINQLIPDKSDSAVKETLLTCKNVCGTDDPGLIDTLVGFAILIVPWTCSLAMQIAIKFISFSIVLELGIRRTFAPIACVDMIGEGLRSPGVRYLKRYFGVFLKMCVCLVICILVEKLTEVLFQTDLKETEKLFESIGGILDYCVSVIAMNFTAVGLMFKAGEYSNDALGV